MNEEELQVLMDSLLDKNEDSLLANYFCLDKQVKLLTCEKNNIHYKIFKILKDFNLKIKKDDFESKKYIDYMYLESRGLIKNENEIKYYDIFRFVTDFEVLIYYNNIDIEKYIDLLKSIEDIEKFYLTIDCYYYDSDNYTYIQKFFNEKFLNIFKSLTIRDGSSFFKKNLSILDDLKNCNNIKELRIEQSSSFEELLLDLLKKIIENNNLNSLIMHNISFDSIKDIESKENIDLHNNLKSIYFIASYYIEKETLLYLSKNGLFKNIENLCIENTIEYYDDDDCFDYSYWSYDKIKKQEFIEVEYLKKIFNKELTPNLKTICISQSIINDSNSEQYNYFKSLNIDVIIKEWQIVR